MRGRNEMGKNEQNRNEQIPKVSKQIGPASSCYCM
jgi:hypothetical protein